MDPFLVEEKNRKLVTEHSMDPNLRDYFEQENLFDGSKYDTERLLTNNNLTGRMLSDYTPGGHLDAEVLFIKAIKLRDTDRIKKLCFDHPANGYEQFCNNIRIIEIDSSHDELGNNNKALGIIREFVVSIWRIKAY